MASAKENSKSNGFSAKQSKGGGFVVCICNDAYPASLERRKIYAVLRDAAAARHNLVRVVDESGEDYLYPADYFVPLRLPANVKLALSRAS